MLTSKMIKETIGKFCFKSILIYHESMHDAVFEKDTSPVGPLLKGQGAMPRSPASLLTAISAVTLSLYFLPRCLRSTVTCGKRPTIVL